MRGPTSFWSALVVAVGLVAAPLAVDAQAPPGHYSVSGDTALDTKTGLLWQRDQVETFMLPFTDALQRCQQLNLGGFSTGWRLPTVRELLTIVDERAIGPMWDESVFVFASPPSYWTSTTTAASPANAWVFTFIRGISMEARDKASSTGGMVRCVH